MKKIVIPPPALSGLLAVIFLIGCASQSSKPNFAQRDSILKELQQFQPSVKTLPPEMDNADSLAAHFADPGPSCDEGLSGYDIYLFPDKTYFYIAWNDVAPTRIKDKGNWIYQNGIINLLSDNIIPKELQPEDRNFIPLLFKYKGKELFLIMGLERDFYYYKEEAAKDNSPYLIMVTTFEKSEPITNGLKAKLFKKYWKPDYLGMHEEAIKLNDEAIALNPKDVEQWFAKGEHLYYLEQNQEAVKVFNKVIELSPDNTDAWFYLACSYSCLKDKENTLKNLVKAIALNVEYKDKARENEDFQWLWQDDDFKKLTFIPGYELRAAAREAISQGRYGEALELSRQAFKANPNFKNNLWHAWLCQGIDSERAGNYEVALLCHNNSLEFDPINNTTLFYIADILAEQKKFDEAVKTIDKIIELVPDYTQAWKERGKFLDESGKYEEAIKAFDKVIELAPTETDGWYYKALTLVKLGRFDEAIKVYDKLIESQADNWYYWQEKGKALEQLGRYEEAIKICDKLIELDPTDFYRQHNKGKVLAKAGRYEEALKVLDRLFEADTDNSSIWYYKGELFCQWGKYDEAIKAYDKSIELDPKYSCCDWYGLARVYSLQKNKEKTLASLAKAMEAEKDTAWHKKGAPKDDAFKWLWEDEEFKKLTK